MEEKLTSYNTSLAYASRQFFVFQLLKAVKKDFLKIEKNVFKASK